MADKKHILTYAEPKQYEDEPRNLEVVKREEVAQRIKEAKGQGDLSENVEYGAVKDGQRDIELRIEELEKLPKNAEAVVRDEIDLDKINIGYKVRLLDVGYDEEMEFYTVGSTRANNLQSKVSNESLVGRALVGKAVGKCVNMETQAEGARYKVLEIQRAS